MDIPIKKLDSDKDTCATVVWRLAAILVNAGRYISIENGPIAVSIPRISINLNLFFPFIPEFKILKHNTIIGNSICGYTTPLLNQKW